MEVLFIVEEAVIDDLGHVGGHFGPTDVVAGPIPLGVLLDGWGRLGNDENLVDVLVGDFIV